MADGGTMAILNTSMDANPQVKLPDSGHDSVRSTKSLSIFVNPDTPNSMARSEEMTISMYQDSPDHPSPTNRSKRRHREEKADKTAIKEKQKSETAKTGGFFKFAKKKKPPDAKSKDSTVTAVESTSTQKGGSEGLGTDVDNSTNNQIEMEIGQTNVASSAAVSSSLSKSTQGEQIKTEKTSMVSKTVEVKSSNSAENRTDVAAVQQKIVNDSNNNATTSTNINVGASTGGALRSDSPEKSTGQPEWRKRVGRQTNDGDKKETVVHSLPTYSPADVDLSSSLARDKNVRAKFEAMLSGQDSGGSGLSSPTSVPGQPKKTYLRRGNQSSTAETPDARSAESTLTRQNRQHEAQGEVLVSTPAIERMAEMQSALKAGQVPKVINRLQSPETVSSVTKRSREPTTENLEYTVNTSADELSLQEDFVMEATTYFGQDILTPPAGKREDFEQHIASSKSVAGDQKLSSNVQEDRKAVAKINTAQGVYLEGPSGTFDVNKTTVLKSGTEAETETRAAEHPSTSTAAKTTHAAQEQKVAVTKVSTAQKVQQERLHGPGQHSASITIGKNRPTTSDQKTKAPTEENRHLTSMSQAAPKDHVVHQTQNIAAVPSIRVEKPGSPDARSKQIDGSHSGSDSGEKERRAHRTRTELDEDRDSTPTPTTMNNIAKQNAQYTKIRVDLSRSPSPGAHGVHVITTDRFRRTSDQSEDAETASKVEQRQHALKARTQAELLEQAKRRTTTTTADAGIGDHNVRTAAKSTYTVKTMNTHASQHDADDVDRVPSKASHDRKEPRSSSRDQVDSKQIRLAGRSDRRVETHHRQQPAMEGYRDESISLEWRHPRMENEKDPEELRAHVRPREHRVPVRTQSNASSDISSSISSQPDVNHHVYQSPSVELNAARRRGSQSSSNATPTEGDNVRSHRGRKPIPTGREPIRRTSSLPMSDEMDEGGDSGVVDFRRRQDYHVAPAIDTRYPQYSSRSKVPVTGRQKIQRNTESSEDTEEPDIVRLEPQIYMNHGFGNDPSVNVEVYEYARRQRHAPSGRPRINHNADVTASSSSPEDIAPVNSGRLYAQRRTPPTDDRDLDAEVSHRSHRQPPTGRTKKINHPDEVDIRVVNGSPDHARNVWNPDAVDDRQYRQMQNARYNRRAPTGRTKAIHHDGHVDVNITSVSPTYARPLGSRQASEGRTTPASASDWLRHQRSGQLTVDVSGQAGDSASLHRAYRSMPDLLDDDRYVDEVVVPSRRSRNYAANPFEDDENVDPTRHRPVRASNPGGRGSSAAGGRVTATIRDTMLEPRELIDSQYRARSLSTSGVDRPAGGGTGGHHHRKRGFITGATVESRGGGGRSRRSGRTSDQPLTDVEDFYSDAGRRRPPGGGGHRPSHVARIYVGGGGEDDDDWTSQDDVMSVFSEPPQLDRSRGNTSVFLSSQSTMPHSANPQRPSAILTPASYRPPSHPMPPPVMPMPQGAFELAHVDTQIRQPMSPVGSPDPTGTISAVDPALRGASKQGTNYHITLTLKPTITATSPRPPPAGAGTFGRHSQTMMTSSSNLMTTPDGYWSPGSPRAVSTLPVYANEDTGWTNFQPQYELRSSLPRRTAETRPSRATHPTQVPTTTSSSRPRSRSRSSTRATTDGQIGFDLEVLSVSSDDQTAVAQTSSVTQRQTNVTEYDQRPQISSSVEFTYSPPYDDQDLVLPVYSYPYSRTMTIS